MSETKLVSLSKIKDNPWRDRVRNPIDKERVDAIAVSIGKTKYWLGTYGRELPSGIVELAFGHHRFEAAKEQGLKEIPIIIEPFTDGEMLVWMAQENVGGGMPVVIEAVYAAVKALSEGKIEVEAPEAKTKTSAIRHAPSFIAGKPSSTTVVDHPYTTYSIARFLGLVKKASDTAKDSVVAALGALETAEIAGAEGGETGKKKAAAMEFSLAKLPVREALKAVSDVKARIEKVADREEKAKQSAAEIDIAQRKLQADRKAAEDKAEAARQVLVEKLAAAKREENDKKARDVQARLKQKAAEDNLKAETFKERQKALDTKVEKAKQAQEAARKVDEYAPIRKETDRILHKIEQAKEALTEDVKALARQKLNNTDRERLRQAAMTTGDWYGEWVAGLFLPPLTSKRRKQ